VLIDGQIKDFDICSPSHEVYSQVKDQLTYLGRGNLVYGERVVGEQVHCWIWKNPSVT
jgi:hypothetical protein